MDVRFVLWSIYEEVLRYAQCDYGMYLLSSLSYHRVTNGTYRCYTCTHIWQHYYKSSWLRVTFSACIIGRGYSDTYDLNIVLCTLYIVGHRCSACGCGETIVIDGKMKSHRNATEAGYVEYLGLPGRVKTGCANTLNQGTVLYTNSYSLSSRGYRYGGCSNDRQSNLCNTS